MVENKISQGFCYLNSNYCFFIRFLKEEISLRTPKLHEIENSEILSDLQSLFKIVDYNPSYRIHQKKCDFKIQFKNSVSLGRGYFYLG